jgi:hypothetical protein
MSSPFQSGLEFSLNQYVYTMVPLCFYYVYSMTAYLNNSYTLIITMLY